MQDILLGEHFKIEVLPDERIDRFMKKLVAEADRVPVERRIQRPDCRRGRKYRDRPDHDAFVQHLLHPRRVVKKRLEVVAQERVPRGIVRCFQVPALLDPVKASVDDDLRRAGKKIKVDFGFKTLRRSRCAAAVSPDHDEGTAPVFILVDVDHGAQVGEIFLDPVDVLQSDRGQSLVGMEIAVDERVSGTVNGPFRTEDPLRKPGVFRPCFDRQGEPFIH